MFNLEHAISEWRRQMRGAGIKSPVPLDELESHLRDEIEGQMKSDRNPQQTFENAVAWIGPANLLQREFKKNTHKEMKRIIMMIAGVIGVSVGMAFVMPAIALYRNQNVMGAGNAALLLFGIALTLGGAGIVWRSYVTRRRAP